MTTVTEMRRIGEGREAEIFDYGDGRVLRLLRSGRSRDGLEREAAAMRAAADAGVPVPPVYEIIDVDGRAGMVMDRVAGDDLLSMIAKRPWFVFASGRITGELHARLNGVEAPAGLPALRDRLRSKVETAVDGGLPAHVGGYALELLDALPDGDRICHGDFHPGNIIGASSPAIIDWPNVTRGDPDADHARTLLMLRLGEPPPGSPALLRAAAKVARSLLVSAYRKAYERGRPPDREMTERWLIVHAAARLAEGIEPERPKLLRMLEEAARGN
jgi:aminoglycoside phosphotransferase (APT) family kinase protein